MYVFYCVRVKFFGNNSIMEVHKTRNGGLNGRVAKSGKSLLTANSAKN
ncbi:hypothetical protein DOY81_009266 [Sarcophaga bullata]|nr:hypothetical protein DOY81_009266 [Sarcophaga bullata]